MSEKMCGVYREAEPTTEVKRESPWFRLAYLGAVCLPWILVGFSAHLLPIQVAKPLCVCQFLGAYVAFFVGFGFFLGTFSAREFAIRFSWGILWLPYLVLRILWGLGRSLVAWVLYGETR